MKASSVRQTEETLKGSFNCKGRRGRNQQTSVKCDPLCSIQQTCIVHFYSDIIKHWISLPCDLLWAQIQIYLFRLHFKGFLLNGTSMWQHISSYSNTQHLNDVSHFGWQMPLADWMYACMRPKLTRTNHENDQKGSTRAKCLKCSPFEVCPKMT